MASKSDLEQIKNLQNLEVKKLIQHLTSKTNILEELNKETENRKQEVQEMNIHNTSIGLLAETYADDVDLYRRIGLKNTSLETKLNLIGDQIQIERLKEEHGDAPYFSVDTIRKLAVDYNLRFVRLSYYKGEIPVDLAEQIRTFFHGRQKLKIQNGDSSDYYVLAPPQLVNPKKEEVKTKANPAIFYRIPDGNGTFALLSTWGHDMPVFRKYLYWHLKDWQSFRTVTTVKGTLALYLVIHMIAWIFSHPLSVFNITVLTICAIFALGFYGIFTGLFEGSGPSKRYLTSYWWDEEKRRHKLWLL